jgi:hypothetical protein
LVSVQAQGKRAHNADQFKMARISKTIATSRAVITQSRYGVKLLFWDISHAKEKPRERRG